MFYAKIVKNSNSYQGDEKSENSNPKNKSMNWDLITKNSDLIECYKRYCKNANGLIFSPTFVAYHDALLRMEVTYDLM